MSVTNLGKVTAYAYAVAGGYTGTEADFEAILGNIASGHGSIANIEKTGTAGSVDTYTITFTDGTTATYDITNGEVTEAQLETILEAYAKTDGYYESMTVGNAEQLNSSVGIVDKEPYNYRAAGGSVEIGNRAYSKWVGGSLPVNQLMPSVSELSATRCTKVVSGNTATLTVDASGISAGRMTISKSNLTIIPQGGHKYYLSYELNTSVALSSSAIQFGNSLSVSSGAVSILNTWQTFAGIKTQTTPTGAYVQNDIYGTFTTGNTVQIRNPQIIDLTLMFGTTIADYIYSLETATPGAGVAWFRKYFPYDYYAYQAPTLEHVTISEYQTTELNQWDEVWEVGTINVSNGATVTDANTIRSKNYCDILSSTSYYMTCQKTDGGNQNRYYLGIVFYDADKTFISGGFYNNMTFTTPTNARYFKIMTNTSTVIYGSTYHNDISINLHWDGEMDGVYQPYKLHSYPLDDSIVLRGVPKKDDSGKLYFDGDTWEADGTVTRKYGIIVFDGSTNENWSYNVNYDGFRIQVVDANVNEIPANQLKSNNFIGANYRGSLGAGANALGQILTYTGSTGVDTQFLFFTTSITDLTEWRTWLSNNKIYLVYPLATPTTEQGPEFNEPQVVDNFGTEALLGSSIPVGHETNYMANLRAKIETAPDSPDGDGDYIMRQTSGANAYVELGSTTTIQNIISRLEALEAE